jgi:hypothetical protein
MNIPWSNNVSSFFPPKHNYTTESKHETWLWQFVSGLVQAFHLIKMTSWMGLPPSKEQNGSICTNVNFFSSKLVQKWLILCDGNWPL